MAVEVKVAPDNQLELKSVFLEDRRVTSQYFNLTELPDTFTGGKNAFLIAGTDYLEPNTEVLVQIRDSTGRVVYTESSDGSPEYYEGISKVIAVYVYPTDSVAQAIDSTAFGPCTITILGELKYYDNDGSKTEVPEIWKGKYNIRYVGTANINPTLANTTRVRFFLRPRVTINEILKPIYSISGSSVSASAIIASYANIKLSRLETFAGDVKRVKVYRSSVSTVSDFELIQDIQIEAKELLQTFDASGSVITDTGYFNSEVLLNFWESGSLSSATLNTAQFSGSTAVKLEGAGNFKYKPYLDLSDVTVYELAFDGFYTGSSESNLEIHISGSQNGDRKVDTLTGLFPTKNFTNYVSQFTLPNSEPSASLYFKQTQSHWYLKDISLRASAETVFSPNEVSFVVSMPTNISNETFNFKFEFFDVNNNYIPVAVTGSHTFIGGNSNVGNIAADFAALSGSVTILSSSVSGSLTQLSQSVSGTISFTSQSISGTLATVSSSVSSSISSSYSSSKYLAESSSLALSSSLSSSVYNATSFLDERIFTNSSGSLIKPPKTGSAGLYTSNTHLGYHSGGVWRTYMSDNGSFYLTSSIAGGGFLAWDAADATLQIQGSINVTGGNAATQTYANTAATNVSSSLAPNIFTDSSGRIRRPPTITPATSGLYIGSTNMGYYNGSDWKTYMADNGNFYLSGTGTNSLTWDGTDLSIVGGGTFTGALTGGTISIGSGNSIFRATTAGIWLGAAAFGDAPFRVNPQGLLIATNATISGTITASNIIGNTFTNGNNFSVTSTGDLTARNAFLTGKIEADSGKIGFGNNFWTINASSIENNVTLNGKVSLNAARPAIEVYDASNELKIDINGGTEFTSRTGGSINTSGGITGNFQVASGDVANGSSGASYYNSTQITYTGQQLTFTAAGANVGKTATLKITATGDAGYSYMEATPSVSLNSISTTYGYLIRKGSTSGTIVATISDSVANSNGAAGTNSLPTYSKTFSTSILLEDSIYYIVPFVQNVNLLGYDVGGITTLTGFVNTPKIASATVSFDVGKTEIIAGGMQIIRSTDAYFKVDRAGSGDIVLIGGSVSVTGDLTANTSSDIRLKGNIQRIPNPMDKILKISGNTFEWLSGFDEIHSHSGNDVGVIAQEIESVLPEIVVTRDNGYKGVHYEKLVALLIEGMKELQSQIDELKNNK